MQEGASQKGLSAAPAGQTVSSHRSGNTEPAETTRTRKAQASPGLEFPRFFSTAGVDPFDQVEWESRDAIIGNEKGTVVFEQRGVEIPKAWSQQATNIVVSKYFRGHVGSPERERSVKQLIGRVVNTITEWARKQKYFASDAALSAFSDDLKFLLVHQKAAFNSPVWFNCGFEKAPQCSACFINAVDDTMDSILDAGQDRGHAVQVRLRHRQQPVGDPLVEGAARRRRHRLGPGVVHEGLRRVRRRHQVGRQDAPRREDGDPQRRASRRPRVHQLQGRGREEGVGADRRRLRRLVHRHRLRLGVLPELEQLGARDRRIHARGARRWPVADQGGHQRRSGRHLPRPRLDARDCRRHLGVRRSRHAVRHHRQRVAHQPEHGAHQRQQPVLGIHVPGRLGVQSRRRST